jgi:hypothetical protein
MYFNLASGAAGATLLGLPGGISEPRPFGALFGLVGEFPLLNNLVSSSFSSLYDGNDASSLYVGKE